MPAHRDEDFNLIKKELVDEVRGWRQETQAINIILTGGNNPKNGALYRLDRLEDFKDNVIKQKEKRDKQIAGTLTACLVAIATGIGDFVTRFFTHHK